jgi:hypothetical protein
VADLEDQIESLKANINYLHENIQDCQQNILQMEQAAGKRTLVSQTDHKNPLRSHDTVSLKRVNHINVSANATPGPSCARSVSPDYGCHGSGSDRNIDGSATLLPITSAQEHCLS